MDSSTRRLQGIVSHLATSQHNEQQITYNSCSSVEGNENLLDHERKNCSFDVREMVNLLDGGEMVTMIKETVVQMIQSDPIFYNPEENTYDLTRPESRRRTMEKVRKTIEMWNATSSNSAEKEIPRVGKKTKKTVNQGKAFADAFWWAMSLYDRSWATRIGVHFGLFSSAIQGQGTEEQVQKYLDDIFSMRIIGCFAMTELGHGSYIRGFETTSTYDKKTQEFIINSPTETSTKFWIGLAGQTATHTVVYARLIIDGTDYGVHSFVVQIRSTQTGEPMNGISVGDCGGKMGRNGLDNGWIQFNQVRIPRDNMLMKWSQVSVDGIYTKPPKSQLSYGALLGGRVSMIRDSSDFAKVALTIAIRYSCIRKQFPSPSSIGQKKGALQYLKSNDANTEPGAPSPKANEPVSIPIVQLTTPPPSNSQKTPQKEQSEQPEPEEQIINYQSHQIRLIPLLATCYAYHFTSLQISKFYEQVTADLENKDISGLPGLHSTSAGLKAFATWWCNEAIEQSRQCLGGHGYSSYSGMASLLADWAVNCTWEGDNTVLAQQTARYLMKCLRKLNKNIKLVGFESYLNDYNVTLNDNKFIGNSITDFMISGNHIKIMKRLATKIIIKVGKRLSEQSKKLNKLDAWNDCMIDLIFAAKVHCDFYTLNCFKEVVEETNTSVKQILIKLYNLKALHMIESYFGYLLEDQYLNDFQIDIIRNQIRVLCKEIRKEAVPLVDSFNFPDWVINSPFGRYDGQVYKHYMQMVKKSANSMGKPDYWNDIIMPLTSKKQ